MQKTRRIYVPIVATTAIMLFSGTAWAAVDPESGQAAGGNQVTISDANNVMTQVSAGYFHSVGLDVDGDAYGWGFAPNSAIGFGDDGQQTAIHALTMPESVKFVDIDVDGINSMALGDDGNVYAWGNNNYGQAVPPVGPTVTTPTMISLPEGVEVVDISQGQSFSVVLGSDGKAYSWGLDSQGQLGQGDGDQTGTQPAAVQMPESVTFTDISAGGFHSLALGTDGNIYAWGYNSMGQIGNGDLDVQNLEIPTVVPGTTGFTEIAAGDYNSAALDVNGLAYGWGENTYGGLGIGNTSETHVPTATIMPEGVTFSDLEIGRFAASAQGSDGNLYGWGIGQAGQVGDSNGVDSYVPAAVVVPEGEAIASVAVGGYHNVGVTESGRIFSWGMDQYGQGGTGLESGNRLVPTLGPNFTVANVTFGDNEATEVSSQGTDVYATVPAGQVGAVQVTVNGLVNAGESQVNTFVRQFEYTYLAPITPRTPPTVSRVGGTDRYDTSYKLSSQTLVEGQNVFLATGANYPDALTAGPAAVVSNSNLMITKPDSVEKRTLDLLAQKKVTKVYVIGGPVAVSDNVIKQVKARLGSTATVERIGGKDRYETSQNIMNKFFGEQTFDTAFVATGQNFPDALSAGGAASSMKVPVLLVPGTAKTGLSKTATQGLLNHQVQTVLVVGGEKVVSPAILESLRGDFNVTRLVGTPNDRYGTNNAVNQYLSSRYADTPPTGVWVASGTRYADALLASAQTKDPSQRLVLSNGQCLSQQVVTDWINGTGATVKNVTLIGGDKVLSQALDKLNQCAA